MKIIACVDDRMGMMFGSRRQSKDRILQEKILADTAGKRLWMNAYSAKQFASFEAPQISVAEDFLEQAEEEDICFVENLPLMPYQEKITSVVLYHWNRAYPGTVFFDLPLADYTLTGSTDFAGFSHETITEEVYCR